MSPYQHDGAIFGLASRASEASRLDYNMVSLDNLWLTAYGGYIGVTTCRQPKSTAKLKSRRATLVVYPFSHSLLSTISLSNHQGMMVKVTFKDLMPIMGSRWLSTVNLPSLLLSLKYKSVEDLLQFLRKKTATMFLLLLPLNLTDSRTQLLPRGKR